MAEHHFEIAPSGRSKCRGCGLSIAKDSVRFGEHLPNPFGEGDMVHWHHPECAAHRRPEPLVATINTPAAVNGFTSQLDIGALQATADITLAHPRLQRMGKLEQASSGRARCRHCKELIAQEAWRVPLIFFNEDTYNTSGFIHLECVAEYTDTDQYWPTLQQFSDLDAKTLETLGA